MNFISGLFALFLTTTFFLFVLLPERYRQWLLLLASYIFYGTWSMPFIGLILLTTTIDYGCSRIIFRHRDKRTRKIFLLLGLTVNLLVLGFFKYFNFFLTSSSQLIQCLGYTVAPPPLIHIILPLGISFYTFEAISYLIDVYRGKAPAKNLLDYNFYIMYFPHLISGPIVRFCELAPQYENGIPLPSKERIRHGLELILLGIVFKVLIADRVAPISDQVFNTPDQVGVLNAYIGVLAFTVQILFDFMGYTHIARGASLLFNMALPINFNFPYLATNISNFWERWHMSLSRWIRDYLYFPLGGSRVSLTRILSNLILTMLIAGAWHGAGWTYILWGGYHGVLLALYHLYRKYRSCFGISNELFENSSVYRLAAWSITFFAVIYGWVLFRSPNLHCIQMISQSMFRLEGLVLDIAHAFQTGHLSFLVTLLFLLSCCVAGPWIIKALENVYRPLPQWLKVPAICIVIVLCWILTSESTQPFIYFQF